MSLKIVLLMAAAMLAACQAEPPPAPAPVRAVPTAEYRALHDVLRRYADEGLFSGVVRVERDHKRIFERGYGLASVELGVPSSPGHRYKLHSATKPILAVAVMRAVQDGRLRLDESICRYLSPCPEPWAATTALHLLNHTSGIPDFSEALIDGWRGSIGATLAHVQPHLAELKPAFLPGTRWAYSNAGYVLLSRMLELIYDRPIGQVLRTLVFDPAGMQDTTLELAPRYETDDPRYEGPMYDGPLVERGQASGYNGSPDALQTAYAKMYVIPGAGSAVTTAADLGRFVEALFSGRLIDAEARKTMLTIPDPGIKLAASPGIPEDKATPLAPSYALGWFNENQDGSVSYHHSGGNNGFIAYFAYYPRQRLTFVLLSNRGFTPLKKMLDEIRPILLGRAPEASSAAARPAET